MFMAEALSANHLFNAQELCAQLSGGAKQQLNELSFLYAEENALVPQIYFFDLLEGMEYLTLEAE